MANTLTNLQPDLYEALDVVSRELVGMINAVGRDSGVERAAKDQTVRSFVAPASTASDVTPGQLPADNGNQTIGNKTITISKSRYVPVRWNGEEQRGMNTGPGYNLILRDQFAQAMRTLTNEIETDLAGLHTSASNAVSPAGTNLFDAANYKDIANVVKYLNLNGAPMTDRHLVLGNSAAAAFRGLGQYYGADVAGSDTFLRQGLLMNMHGVAVHEGGQMVEAFAEGTQTSTDTNDAGYAIGATEITLDASTPSGTGTIIAGDVITFAGDTNKYVVQSGDADTSNGGTITLAAPGLKQAIPAAETAITTVSSAQRNMAFSRNAIQLVTRVPARPLEGDSAEDVMIIQDPRSGLAFEVSMYKEYRQVKFEIAMAWGYSVIKPEHLILLVD